LDSLPPTSDSPLAPEDPQAILCRAEWLLRARRQRRAGWLLIAWTGCVTIFVAVAISGLVNLPDGAGLAIFPVYFLPVLFYSLFSMINYRCPRCSKTLTRLRHPRFCFNCGLRLRE
jgi:hypothetical protein